MRRRGLRRRGLGRRGLRRREAHLLDLLELARVEDLAVALREARARQDARVVVLLGAKVVDRHELRACNGTGRVRAKWHGACSR
eukprot:6741201-Prymnesium_polylepis.1